MKILRIILIIIFVTAIAVFGYWYLIIRETGTAANALTGSGTVETTQITISPEVTGRVVEVSVSQGQSVKAGDALFKLDDGLLTAQRNQAQVNLEAAQAGLDGARTALAAAQAGVATTQAQYDLALASARQQAQPARSAAWGQDAPSEFDQPNWYFTHAEKITAAQDEVSASDDVLTSASTSLSALMSGGAYMELVAVEARLALAQAAFLDATDVLDRAQSQDILSLQDAAQGTFDNADSELAAAQQAYADLLTTQETQDILAARARLAVAQERHDTAVDRYNALLTGEDSLAVKVSAQAVDQAEANVAATESKIIQAQKAIDQAQAAFKLTEIQLGKLAITAPVDGVVLARNIEPGEVVLAGATAFTLGQLEHLTITVYILENRYGEVKLGDHARVSVDSFPDQAFDATVTRIADQAEFTPRNVQTAEGRQTTVFAVELSVQNPVGLLKPGMPADVTFDLP